jgi:hypothetical protein
MKKLLAVLSAASLLVSAQAGDKDLAKTIEDQGIYVETAQKGITLSGYVDTSYTYQFDGGKTQNNAAVGENSLRAFDNESGFNINAVKIALEKALPDANEYAAGFRVDLMAGEDAQILNIADPVVGSTAGFNDNPIYLEQAYVQFRAPIGNGLDFKFGKFVTPMGYEVIESPANLNFSRGLLFTNAIPLTHTGIMASYKFNDIIDVQGGIVNGWNNSDSTSSSVVPAFLGRVNVTAPGGNANIAQSVLFSPDGERGDNGGVNGGGASSGFTENETVFLYDVWGNWAPKFANDKLLLGFNVDLGVASDDLIGTSNGDTWFGAALYAKYQFTKVFSLAGRAEYLHGTDGSKFALPTGVNNVDAFSWTLTAGFNIWENLLTRIEYRADFAQSDVINGQDQHQIAVNLVYSF